MFLILSKADPRQPESEPVAAVVTPPDSPAVVVAEPEPDMRMGSADQIREAHRFASLGKAMTLLDPERPGQTHLVGPDLACPDVWRHTLLIDQEPWSDHEFSAAEDAFLSALRAGGLPAHNVDDAS